MHEYDKDRFDAASFGNASIPEKKRLIDTLTAVQLPAGVNPSASISKFIPPKTKFLDRIGISEDGYVDEFLSIIALTGIQNDGNRYLERSFRTTGISSVFPAGDRFEFTISKSPDSTKGYAMWYHPRVDGDFGIAIWPKTRILAELLHHRAFSLFEEGKSSQEITDTIAKIAALYEVRAIRLRYRTEVKDSNVYSGSIVTELAPSIGLPFTPIFASNRRGSYEENDTVWTTVNSGKKTKDNHVTFPLHEMSITDFVAKLRDLETGLSTAQSVRLQCADYIEKIARVRCVSVVGDLRTYLPNLDEILPGDYLKIDHITLSAILAKTWEQIAPEVEQKIEPDILPKMESPRVDPGLFSGGFGF